MDPVNHVVADIHRVETVRQESYLKRILEARCLECLVPP